MWLLTYGMAPYFKDMFAGSQIGSTLCLFFDESYNNVLRQGQLICTSVIGTMKNKEWMSIT